MPTRAAKQGLVLVDEVETVTTSPQVSESDTSRHTRPAYRTKKFWWQFWCHLQRKKRGKRAYSGITLPR
jgi:hypothetical protein